MSEPTKDEGERPGWLRDLIRDLQKVEAPDGGFVIVKGTAVGPTESGHIGFFMDEFGPWPPMIDPAKDEPEIKVPLRSFEEFQAGIAKMISAAYGVPEELLCETYKKIKMNDLNKKIEPHQSRVLEEQKELEDKIAKLQYFVSNSPVFKNLGDFDKDMLILQLSAMESYNHILQIRIKLF